MVRLATNTTTAAAGALADAEVAVLPTGATEQHGPALPLGTDFETADAFAGTLADRPDVAVLPTVPVGVSDHHRQFDGTLWVGPETFERYVRDVLASVASHGIRRAVVVNGHGGNTEAIRRAARALRAGHTAFVAPWNWWESVEGLADEVFEESGGHADAMESSVVMHVASDQVREDALGDAEAGAADGWGKQVHGAGVGFDTADFSESGAVGSPTQASPEKGRRVFEGASEELAALVDWLADRPLEDLWPRDHR